MDVATSEASSIALSFIRGFVSVDCRIKNDEIDVKWWTVNKIDEKRWNVLNFDEINDNDKRY